MMRSNITTQLFAVMLGLCLLVIVAIGIANAWSVRQAFNDYTLQQDNQRAEVVAGTLAELYRQTGSWQILRDRPQLWQDILSMDEASRPTDEHSGGRPVVPRNLRSHWSLLDPRNRVVAGNAHPGQDAQRYGIVIAMVILVIDVSCFVLGVTDRYRDKMRDLTPEQRESIQEINKYQNSSKSGGPM